jgi:hypothetical protein
VEWGGAPSAETGSAKILILRQRDGRAGSEIEEDLARRSKRDGPTTWRHWPNPQPKDGAFAPSFVSPYHANQPLHLCTQGPATRGG